MKKLYSADSIYFTADHHILHTNILRIMDRPYDSMNAMIEDVVAKWNKKVKATDTVFILGDFIWSVSPHKCRQMCNRLNGNKYLILGNHDKETKIDRDCFIGIDRLTEIQVRDEEKTYDVTLCHYPMGSWSQSYRGSIQLFGHCHGNYNKDRQLWNQMDIGFDIKYDLFSWSDIKEILSKQLMEFKSI